MAANGIIGVLLIAASTLALPDGAPPSSSPPQNHYIQNPKLATTSPPGPSRPPSRLAPANNTLGAAKALPAATLPAPGTRSSRSQQGPRALSSFSPALRCTSAGFQRQTVLTDDHLGSTMLMQIVFFPDDQQRCLLLDKNGQIFIGYVPAVPPAFAMK